MQEVKYIPNKKELAKYLSPMYIVHDYMRSMADYKKFQESMYNLIKGCFEIKECREYPVKFKFYLKEKETYTLQLRHFVVNVFAWFPFINLYEFSDILDKSFIIDCFNDIPNISEYINEKIISVLRDYSIRNTTINYSVSEVLYNLRRISVDFSQIMNLQISSETFLNLYKTNSRIREIMETEFSMDMQPADIEHQLTGLMDEEIDIYKSIKDNPVGIILRANTGIKHKQFSEFTINQGLKPDLTGVTIPIPINSSTLVKGLDVPSYHYIDALGARKSLVLNKTVMGSAGYFGKLVLELAQTLSLSKTVSDCDTRHYVTIHINSQKMLNKYNGRYYKINEDDSLMLINSKKDKHLVGQTILLRSPVTCACGDTVCHRCFGRASLLNLDIAAGISGFESEEVTKVVNQMILSTKHLLTTISEKIEFNDNFYRFFTLYAAEINPNINAEDNLDDWGIYIAPEDIQKCDELDDDSSFNTYINGKFMVHNFSTGEDLEIFSINSHDMYLTEEAIELMKHGKGYMRFRDMDENTVLFSLVIFNNELTRPLYQLMDLLNKSNKDSNGDMSYSEMCQTFTELLLDANIKAMAVAGEVIINRLIRKDPDTDFERPDFTRKNLGPYKILTVRSALENNKSPLIGISSQNVKRQLLSDDTVDKKTGTSYIDPLFRTKTSTKKLMNLHNELMTEDDD